jgi:hypothetical protein
MSVLAASRITEIPDLKVAPLVFPVAWQMQQHPL